jgi:hypothetical protein
MSRGAFAVWSILTSVISGDWTWHYIARTGCIDISAAKVKRWGSLLSWDLLDILFQGISHIRSLSHTLFLRWYFFRVSSNSQYCLYFNFESRRALRVRDTITISVHFKTPRFGCFPTLVLACVKCCQRQSLELITLFSAFFEVFSFPS